MPYRGRGSGCSYNSNLSLGFQFQRRLIGAALFELLIDCAILGVHQIEVEILHAAGFQLLFILILN